MTHIWVPKFKILEPKDALASKSRVEGRYKIEAVRPDGTKRLLADWFPNLITDVGLERIGTARDWLDRCAVGTGNTAPAFANTALVALVGSTTTIQTSSSGNGGASDYYQYNAYTYRFAAGVATGNLAEVGVGNSTTNLYSRALILTAGGVPTTITVLASEALDVTYEHRIYPPLGDATGTINISGTDYDYTLRGANIDGLVGGSPFVGGGTAFNSTAWSGAIGATNLVIPTGSSATASGMSTAAYSPGTLRRDITQVWGLTSANFGGVNAISFNVGNTGTSNLAGAFQIGFDAPIPKTASNILTLVTRHIWARR